MHQKEKKLTIPNLLSFYRLLTFPIILWLIFTGDEKLFITLFCINLITDILDGWIARTFHMQSVFGARLDSLADTGSVILAITGLFSFHKQFVSEHSVVLFILIILYILPYLISLIRFKIIPGLHLYSGKVTGYIQGLFFFSFFLWGYAPWFFYLTIIISCLSYMEEIILLSIVKELRTDAKSIFHFRRNKTKQ